MRKEFTEQIEYVRKLKERGAEMMAEQIQKSEGDPPADLGIFGGSTFPAFEFDKHYLPNELFSYEGKPGYIKQEHTSQETWIPFTAGTESLYGARPKMNSDGTFDYIYNMAAEVGIRVNHESKTYECIQAIGDMLFPPNEIPAHFMEVVDENLPTETTAQRIVSRDSRPAQRIASGGIPAMEVDA